MGRYANCSAGGDCADGSCQCIQRRDGAGIAVGLECTAIPVIVISIAIVASFYLGNASSVAHAGLFGTAVATMGMLMSVSIEVLAPPKKT